MNRYHCFQMTTGTKQKHLHVRGENFRVDSGDAYNGETSPHAWRYPVCTGYRDTYISHNSGISDQICFNYRIDMPQVSQVKRILQTVKNKEPGMLEIYPTPARRLHLPSRVKDGVLFCGL